MHTTPPHEAARARRFGLEFEQASHDLTGALSEHLREHARHHGWPSGVLPHLSVCYADGAFHPVIADAGADQARLLEYGSLDTRPQPALRTWASMAHENASELHDRSTAAAVARELF